MVQEDFDLSNSAAQFSRDADRRVGMIHQPHFLPWPGYLARCLASDVFVVLDDVLFKRNHFQQRTKYIDRSGNPRWLSLPISGANRTQDIAEAKVASSFRRKEWQRGFVNSYRGFEAFDAVWSETASCIDSESPSLLQINMRTIRHLLDVVGRVSGANTPAIELSSTMVTRTSRTGRLVDICNSTRITHLFMGKDALVAHDINALRSAGLSIVENVHLGPQRESPTPGVTFIDSLLRLGAEEASRRLLENWVSRPSTKII
jgi:hypothetical protein